MKHGRIFQLVPVENWWSVYKDENDKKFYYKIAFFALIEYLSHQDIVPIDFDEKGMWDLEPTNRVGLIYSETKPKDEV